MNKKLEAYEKATVEMVQEFIDKLFTYDDGSQPEWRFVGDDVGDVIDIGCSSYFTDVRRVREALRYNATFDQFNDYYELEDEADFKNLRLNVNFKNYVLHGTQPEMIKIGK